MTNQQPQAGKRLNKYISESGFCSRREADRLIEQQRVKINNQLPNSDLVDKKGFFLGLHNIKISDTKLKFLTDSIYSSL